jgi:hypothetical protein
VIKIVEGKSWITFSEKDFSLFGGLNVLKKLNVLYYGVVVI